MKVTIKPTHVVEWCCDKHYQEPRAEIARLRAECEALRCGLKQVQEGAIKDVLALEDDVARLTRERDEVQQKGEKLCAWIGYLLTTLGVSTPEEGVADVSRRLEHSEKADAVVRAAERWVIRKGHGSEGHQCDLCDAIATYRGRA